MEQAGLFSPIRINSLEMPNRVIMSPMFSNSAGEKGVVTQNTIKHYVDRARSGVGLIMTEHTSVCSHYIHPGKRLQISEDFHVAGLKQLVDAVHRENCKIGLQIAHSIHGKGKVPADLTKDECYHIMDQFVDGARRAKEAGFDALELHYAHTYTMADFISRRTNTRTDEFGGDIYGRMFLHLEILKRIRALLGPNFPIFVRISAEEFIVGGNTLVQSRIFARELEKNGADCIDVSAGVRFDDGGLKGYSDQRGKPSYEYPDGPNVYLAEDIKKYVKVPVVTVGKLGNPDVAKSVIEEGRADMVALARPLIADPMWVKKVQAGRDDLVNPCLYCTECLYDRWDPEAYVHCMRYTCQIACPAGVAVPVYIDQAYHGDLEGAYRTIQRENPFPLACGRICNHVCETLCNRTKIDEPVAIRNVKRYVTDRLMEDGVEFPVPEQKPANGRRIAVVGSGPSGLSCAFYLKKNGYDVTVYEAKDYIGGMMAAGIPEYRLPAKVLEKELNVFRKMGIQFVTGTRLGRDISLESLKKDGFDAIYLGLGAGGSRKLGIPGEDTGNVLSGIGFLGSVREKRQPDFQGKRIVVVGGGNVAMDAARTALRLGAASVQLFCLEARSEMPANSWEIAEALEDGIFINNSWGPKKVLSKDGHVSRILFKECSSVFQNGRFSPQYNEDNVIGIDADYLIVAIGQSVLTDGLTGEIEAILNPRGVTAAFAGTTKLPYVFSGGDCTAVPATVVKCANDGKLAAGSIDLYLGGSGQVVDKNTIERVKTHENDETPQRREQPLQKTLGELADPFEECEKTITEEQMRHEACRCLRCDVLKCKLS